MSASHLALACTRGGALMNLFEIGDLVRFKNRGNGHPDFGVILRIEYNINRRRDEAMVMWSNRYECWSFGWFHLGWIKEV